MHDCWPGFSDAYTKGKDLPPECTMGWVFNTALRLFERAKVVKNIDRAISLRTRMDVTPVQDSARGELLLELSNIYEHRVDDMFIIAGFETYACATLLSKQYVLHVITRGSQKEKQRNSPIEFSEVQGTNTKFSEMTLSLSTLLKSEYSKILKLDSGLGTQIGAIGKARNTLHFAISVIQEAPTTERLSAIKSLHKLQISAST